MTQLPPTVSLRRVSHQFPSLEFFDSVVVLFLPNLLHSLNNDRWFNRF